jgi:hypothetical protein
VRESSVPSSSQRQRALCVGRHGSKRQQRFMAGLEQGILSSSVTCRFGALQLAAELAAAFVSDGCPVLIIATAAAGDSCASVSSAVQPSAAVTFSARRAMQHSLSAADARIHSHTPLFLRRLALLLTDSRCIETAAAFLREASPCLHQVHSSADSRCSSQSCSRVGCRQLASSYRAPSTPAQHCRCNYRPQPPTRTVHLCIQVLSCCCFKVLLQAHSSAHIKELNSFHECCSTARATCASRAFDVC